MNNVKCKINEETPNGVSKTYNFSNLEQNILIILHFTFLIKEDIFKQLF